MVAIYPWHRRRGRGPSDGGAKLSHPYGTIGRMWGRRRRRRRSGWLDGCDCDLPCCDLGLLSPLLLLLSHTPGDRAVIGAIKAYRRLSPRLPTRCRFSPTCSAYGLAAVRRYGVGQGLRLTAGRLARCRPGVAYGTLDPVP